MGIPAAVWSRKAVRDLIRRGCGITPPVRAVGAYLQRWGDTAKVPRRHARGQDPEEVAEWLEWTSPAIERRAAREGAEIRWCDEIGARADEQPRRGYARIGHPAWIEVPAPHIRMDPVATITPEGEVPFLTWEEAMTAALFIPFLERLLCETTRAVFLIADRLRAHEAEEVEDWRARHRGRIEWSWLPKDSPELNADGSMTHELKGAISAAGLPESSGDLRSRIEWFMTGLLRLPKRVRDDFRHPCVQYAAARNS